MIGGLKLRPYLLPEDYQLLREALKPLITELYGSNIFITGGTGFFGKWLLNSIKLMNDELSANISATILSRSPEKFLETMPHLRHATFLRFREGDVRNSIVSADKFSYIIHAASVVSSPESSNNPLAMIDTIVSGTRNVLNFAVKSGVQSVLLTSSGAVYGQQPPDLEFIPEDYLGGPNCSKHEYSYHEAKRMAELLATAFAKEYSLKIKIARCFAFMGPHLPLNEHFAIGNFVRDALNGVPITINGDGRTVRSYMYGADLVVWLWTILVKGKSIRPYNVGSPEPISILKLAEIIQAIQKSTGTSTNQTRYDVEFSTPSIGVLDQKPNRYVPSIDRASNELGLMLNIGLHEGTKRMLTWHDKGNFS